MRLNIQASSGKDVKILEITEYLDTETVQMIMDKLAKEVPGTWSFTFFGDAGDE